MVEHIKELLMRAGLSIHNSTQHKRTEVSVVFSGEEYLNDSGDKFLELLEGLIEGKGGIQPGDTVTLKSGGPKMTVCEVTNREEGDTAKCVYFPVVPLESPIGDLIKCAYKDEVQILEVQLVALTKVG